MSSRQATTIRSARPSDEDAIVGLIRELAAYERLEDQVEISAADITRQLFGKPAAAEALIAQSQSDIVGFALFFQNFSTWRGRPGLYLEDLFVKPEHRGGGIGKALLIELARIARLRNYARMEWSVLDWNTPAIEFYRSLGAESMDEWTTFRLSGAALTQLAQGRAASDA